MKDYTNTKILANYFRGAEAVGGTLSFDETGMTFSSHALNIQTGATRIEYSEIDCAKIVKKLIPSFMSVFTKDGTEHVFVVYHRKKIIEFLESKKR